MCGDSRKRKPPVGITTKTILFWKLLAEMVPAHRLGTVRAGRVSIPFYTVWSEDQRYQHLPAAW